MSKKQQQCCFFVEFVSLFLVAYSDVNVLTIKDEEEHVIFFIIVMFCLLVTLPI